MAITLSRCVFMYVCRIVDPMCVYVCMLAGKNENQKKIDLKLSTVVILVTDKKCELCGSYVML